MSDKEIVFYLNNKEVDSIDPYYSHKETELGVEVEGVYDYFVPNREYDRFEVMDKRKRPLWESK